METQVAIGSLLRRFPHLTLADEAEWGPNFAIRGLKALRVEFGRRSTLTSPIDSLRMNARYMFAFQLRANDLGAGYHRL
jgi:hypothetical protein